MHTTLSLLPAPLTFASRYAHPLLLARARRALLRWRIHTGLEALALELADLKFNPFLFQIESKG
jgi:hypothetical protein